MNFDFINELRGALEDKNIFIYSLIGCKLLASGFVLAKIVILILKRSTQEQFDYMELGKLLGYIILVGAGDKILDAWEHILTMVDNVTRVKESNLYENLMYETEQVFAKRMQEMSGWDILTGASDLLVGTVIYLVVLILSLLFKLADLSITASYLLQRVFIIEILKFLFPLVIVLSLWGQWENLFISWLKRAFGTAILGVMYIAIINFTELVQVKLLSQFQTETGGADFTVWASGTFVAVIVIFTLKVKLFAFVTSYINSYFS